MNNTIDNENGGFLGNIDFYGNVDKFATKGGVQNARILWTFSKAFNVLGEKKYLDIATRAYEYINTYFKDKEFNGIYWELDYKGQPKNTQKYCYAQGFWIYGLSEYFTATKNQKALDLALEIFTLIEEKAVDRVKNGYIEAFSNNWERATELRLSAKDLNESKTYNTHLHVLEGYASLYRVSKNEKVGKALENLVELMLDKFYNPKNNHFNLFFNDDWQINGDLVSYGHDIEGSWLLWDAIIALDNDTLKKKALSPVLKIVDTTIVESIDQDGGQYYEGNSTGVDDYDKHWWPQAEAAIGFVNAWQLTGNNAYLTHAHNSWNFIEKFIVDNERGEWIWKVSKEGLQDKNEARAGFWKCPYHNSRACFEIIERLKNIS